MSYYFWLLFLFFLYILANVTKYKFIRIILIFISLIGIYKYKYNNSPLEELSINNSDYSWIFKDTGSLYKRMPNRLKSISVKVNKFSYWYRKTLYFNVNDDPNICQQYFSNVTLYYKDIINDINGIVLSINTPPTEKSQSVLLNNIKIKLTRDIHKLKNIISENMLPLYNSKASLELVDANDTTDMLYQKHYSVV